MALDTLAVCCLVRELESALASARIDKIHQPERDEILISFRAYQEHYRLVLSASAAHPRVHFTNTQKENPAAPPMFCMLLRKYLAGGKVAAVTQPHFERIIQFDIESYNELGDLTVKKLIVELMGRHSNIILVSENNQIIDSIKHVDFTVSSVRQILPGLPYASPPAQDRPAVLSDAAPAPDFSNASMRADKAVLSSVAGISPLTAREIVYEACGRCDLLCADLSAAQQERIKNLLAQLQTPVFSPCMITDAASGKVLDFSAIPIRQYEDTAAIQNFDSMNTLLDVFYSAKDSADRIRQKSADLVKLLHTNLERLSKKLAIQQSTLKQAENKEQYKIYGDLLTANLYKITDKAKSVTVENYYEPGAPAVCIELDPKLSPSRNAQRYYKRYNKAKTAEIEVAKQMEHTLEEIEYLGSTLALLENCTTESDLNAIRRELTEQGYIKRRTQVKKGKQQQAASKPMHFISSDGFDIYVGKNNTQNDYLTLRFANSQDLWFHTKKIHGSHTIIKLGTDKNIPERTIREAAALAAYYSKARDSSQVPVDYTIIKNVHKPNGAKPGMVIYDSYNTLYVTPALLQETDK